MNQLQSKMILQGSGSWLPLVWRMFTPSWSYEVFTIPRATQKDTKRRVNDNDLYPPVYQPWLALKCLSDDFPSYKGYKWLSTSMATSGISHDDTVAKSVRPSVVHQGCGVNDLNGSGQDDHLAGANGFNGCPDWESPDESRGNMLFLEWKSLVNKHGKWKSQVPTSPPVNDTANCYFHLPVFDYKRITMNENITTIWIRSEGIQLRGDTMIYQS